MTSGPSSFSCYFHGLLSIWRSGPRETYESSGIYLPAGFGFPIISEGLFFCFDWHLGMVFAFLSDFDLEESLPRLSLRLLTRGAF